MWDGQVPIFDQLVSEQGYPFGHDFSSTMPDWDDWTEAWSHYRIGHTVGIRTDHREKRRGAHCKTCKKFIGKTWNLL